MKTNYQLVLDKIIEKNVGKTPKLLLHSCCAPCSSYTIKYLSNYFDITIYYYNPNIDPQEEFEKRAKEQIRLINEINPSLKNKVKFILGRYEEEKFIKISKGFEDEPEGGIRCIKCYHMRMEVAAIKAKELGFDYFTSTLSISPYKNADKLNKIGSVLERKYNVKFLYADFKKKNGYKESINLSNKFDLYRQDYCGCIFSFNETKERRQNKN